MRYVMKARWFLIFKKKFVIQFDGRWDLIQFKTTILPVLILNL